MWAITSEERSKYDKQFDSLSPALGYVSGDQARKFFLLSGLPPPVLAQIWTLADLNKDGKMDRLEFSIAMKLIKLKLTGQSLPTALPLIMKQPPAPSSAGPPRFGTGSMPNLSIIPVTPALLPVRPLPMAASMTSLSPLGGRSLPVPAGGQLPRFLSLSALAMPSGAPGFFRPFCVPLTALPPVSSSLSSSTLGLTGAEVTKAQSLVDLGPSSSVSSSAPSLANSSAKAASVDWAVPQACRLKYRQFFNALDKQMTGFLSGPQVRSALTASHLTQTQLATIWNLADVDKDGRLAAEEFILAMHLVDMAKMGLPLPHSLPVTLVPPSLREGKSGDRVNGTTPTPNLVGASEKAEAELLLKAVDNVTFEDKRKQNFDRGHVELEKRRQALEDQQQREQECRAQKAREQQEKRQREAREEVLRRQLEQERRLERQREIERQKEEERKRELERKEAAKRELERQRKIEWERRRRQELLSQRNQEQEDIVRLKAKKRSLELELEAVGDKHKQISDRLRDVQSRKRIQKGELDLVNQRRDRRVNEINTLQQQFEDCQKKLSQLVPEQQKLCERLRNIGLSNLPTSTMAMLKRSVSEKDTVCGKMKGQLEALEKETRSKLLEMDQNSRDIKELRESQRKQQSALEKLYTIREDKLRELERRREQDLEKRKREEEEADRQARLEEEREAALREEEEERRRQETLRREVEERKREVEEHYRKEEERQKQEKLQRDEEERQREEQERQKQEKLQREEEERQKQEKLQMEEEERKRGEEERRRLEEEEETRRQLQEEREEEEHRRREKLRQEEEEREAKPKEEDDRKSQALLWAEKEQAEQNCRAAEEEQRKQEQRKVAEEVKRRHEEDAQKRRAAEEEKRKQELYNVVDEMKRRQEEEQREKERREQEVAAARQKEEEAAAAARQKQEAAEAARQKEQEEEKEAAAARQEEEAVAAARQKEEAAEAARQKEKEEVAAAARQKEQVAAAARQKQEAAEAARQKEEVAAAARQKEQVAAAARQKEEVVSQNQQPQTSTKTKFKGKVAALLKGIEERKGSKRDGGKAHRKSAALVTYRALYSFTARSGEELSFDAADLIEVDETREGEKGWLSGSLRGAMGWFPVSYVEKQTKPEASTVAKQTLAPQTVSSIPSSRKPEDESSVPKTCPSVPSGVGQSSALTSIPDPGPTPGSAPTEHEPKVANLLAQALCSWEAQTDSHLSFFKDAVITVLEQQDEWWLGELDGTQGWFPASFVTLTTGDGAHTDQPHSPVDGYDMSDGAQQEEYVALYTYESSNLGDLTFNEGDTILVMERGGDWWKGSIGNRTGVFPSNYVKPKETDTSSKTGRPGAPSKKPEIAKVTRAYTARGEEQLTLAPGQLILLLTKTPTGWWLGELQARGKKRKKGWFPGSHVKLLGSSGGSSAPASVPTPVCQVVAMYDYQAANEDEISFSSSKLINVLDKSDPDWWKGEIDGVTGLFPTNYVKMTTDSDPSQQCLADVDAVSPQEKKRQDCIQELIESAERHADDLQTALEVFYKLMSESGRLTEDEIGMIFLNWNELIVSSNKLLKALQERKKKSGERMPVPMIGDVLASELSDMQAYVSFCSSQLKGAALLQRKTDQEPEFKDFLKKIATDYRCKGMPLSSFLLKPMQRITRYPLIIKNIMESTPETHIDHGQLQGALERASELCSLVNERVRDKENADRLEWLQSHVQCDGATENLVFNSLTNCLGPRKFLHSGKVHNKSKGNKELYAFLFNDFLLLTHAVKQFSSSGGDKLFSHKCNMQFKMYKMPVFLNEVLVKLPSDPSSEEPVFHISHIDRVYTLKTESINERTAWVQKIKAASGEFLDMEVKKREKTYQGRSQDGSGIGRLLVTILEAIELKSCKPNGKGNPYCEVTMGEQCYTSRTLNDTLNPKWNFNCQFFIKDLYQDVLCIAILERDLFAPDGFLGRTEVPLATIKKELENKGPANRRLLLHEVPTGEVWVQLDLQLFDQKPTT